MQMQIQHNQASCLLYAVAMATDIKAEKLIEDIGHDGSEISFPDFKIPFCYRGFHIQELILSTFKYQYCLVPIERELRMGNDASHLITLPIFDLEGYIKSLPYNAVLLNSQHAVAWDSTTQWIFNPNGTIYQWDRAIFDMAFLAIKIAI